MKSTTAMFCFLLLTTSLFSTSLNELMDSESFKYSFTGTGKSSGDVIQATLENTGMKKLEVEIPSGYVFENPDAQDMLITQPHILALAPNEKKVIKVKGYCTEPFESVPSDDQEFTFAMGTETEQQLVDYMQGKNFSRDLVQEAVWSLSEDFPLYGIYEAEDQNSDALLEAVADILGEEVPDYSVEFDQTENQPFEDQVSTVHLTFEYELEKHVTLDFIVYDPEGEIVFVIFENRTMSPAKYSQNLDLTLTNYPRGMYTVALLSNNEPLEQKEIMI